VCDTLCLLGDGVTLFAKNSDRPMSEPQIVEAFPRRPPGGGLCTQYLEIPDNRSAVRPAVAPDLALGREHGNQRAPGGHRQRDDLHPRRSPSRRPRSHRHGPRSPRARTGPQRRRGPRRHDDPPRALRPGGSATRSTGSRTGRPSHRRPHFGLGARDVGTDMGGRPVVSGAAISNRVTLRRDWTRASADVDAGTDIDTCDIRVSPTGFADTRLAAGRSFLEAAGAPAGPGCDPRAVVGALRDHGTGPWGVPGESAAVAPRPGARRCLTRRPWLDPLLPRRGDRRHHRLDGHLASRRPRPPGARPGWRSAVLVCRSMCPSRCRYPRPHDTSAVVVCPCPRRWVMPASGVAGRPSATRWQHADPLRTVRDELSGSKTPVGRGRGTRHRPDAWESFGIRATAVWATLSTGSPRRNGRAGARRADGR